MKRFIKVVFIGLLLLLILSNVVFAVSWDLKFPIFVTSTGATATTGTTAITGSPIKLVIGANSVVVTGGAGNVAVVLPPNTTGVASGVIVNPNPTSLVAGSQLVVLTGNGTFTVTISTIPDRTYYPVDLGFGATQMIEADQIASTALDTNMQIGSTSIPYMMGTTKVMAVIPSLPANSSQSLDLYTGYSPAQTRFPIVVGDGGYATIAHTAVLEPGANPYYINMKGYTQTESELQKYWVNNEESLKVQNVNNGQIIGALGADDDTTATAVHSHHWSKQQVALTIGQVVTSVCLKVDHLLSPLGNMDVMIRDAAGTSANYTSGSIVAKTVEDNGEDWYDIALTSWTVPATATYSIVVSAPDGVVTDCIYWRRVDANLYVSGQRGDSTDSGATWADVAASDYAFIIKDQTNCYGDTSTSVAVIQDITSGIHAINFGRSSLVNVDYSGINTEIIDIQDDPVLFSGAGDYTKSFWMNLDVAFPGDSAIFVRIFGGESEKILWYTPNTLTWVINDGGVILMTRSCTFTPVAGMWYNLVFIRSGNNWDIYINGIKQGVTTVANITVVPPANVLTSNEYYLFGTSGRFADIRYVSRALTSIEIQEYLTMYYNDNTGLEVYLPLNEGAGVNFTNYTVHGITADAPSGCSWVDTLRLNVDGNIVETTGANTPGSVNAWNFMQNNVLSYTDYITHTVSNVEFLKYRPAELVGTATYTTGTATFTQTSTVVTGVGTVWDNTMVNCVIKDNADAVWYIVDSVTDSTHLILNTAYTSADDAGAAYTINPGLDDVDNNYNAKITLGTNISISITYGAMVSSVEYAAISSGALGVDFGTSDMPSTWFGDGTITGLPFYDAFSNVSLQTGQPVKDIYFIGMLGLAIGLFLVLVLLTRSALLGVLAFNIVLFIGSSMGIVAMWIPFAILIVQIGIMYLSKQVAY